MKMKHKLSIKIFVILLIGILIILGVSMKLNIDTQKNLYCAWIRETYNSGTLVEDLTVLLEKYGIKQDQDYEKEYLIKILHQSDFKDEFNRLGSYTSNYIFISFFDEDNQIEVYTLGTPYEDNYLVLDNGDIIHIQQEQNNDLLLKILKQNIEKKDYSPIEISYCIENDQTLYYSLELTNQQKRMLSQDEKMLDISYHVENYIPNNQTKKGKITSFCINGECCMYDVLYQQFRVYQLSDIKSFVEDNKSFASGGYVSYYETLGNNTYFLTNFMPCGKNTSLNINIVNVVSGLNEFVIKQYLTENYRLYIISFIVAVIIAFLMSYSISKPIKKLEISTLKIAQNNFDEEIKVKSKDEIGSLAKSIDIMRKQLKETIEQLNQEIDYVKELESLRKDFINQFSHEMKTPLGIINGYSELIEEAESEEEIQKYLDIINKETSKVNQLIQSQLNLSRLEAGKVELNLQTLDLEDIVTEVVDEYEVLLMKKNIKVDIQPLQTHIVADNQYIITVIHNFMSNAIKHTVEHGKIVVTINQGIAIFNEGMPIAQNQLESIWYTFVTHDHEGSGLGLAICRSILELHHFQYGVVNKKDGVQFYFYENQGD